MIPSPVTVKLWQITATDLAMKFSKTPPEQPPTPVWIARSQILGITRMPSKFGTWRPCDVTLDASVAKAKSLA